MEELTEEEKKALRGSKFAPLPSTAPSSSRSNPRLAHPGGPMKTNKAAALAKFLERKLQDPNGLASLDPRLIEHAVKNAKDTVQSSGVSGTGRIVQHVDSFGICRRRRVKSISPEEKKRKTRRGRRRRNNLRNWKNLQVGLPRYPKRRSNYDRPGFQAFDFSGCSLQF